MHFRSWHIVNQGLKYCMWKLSILNVPGTAYCLLGPYISYVRGFMAYRALWPSYWMAMPCILYVRFWHAHCVCRGRENICRTLSAPASWVTSKSFVLSGILLANIVNACHIVYHKLLVAQKDVQNVFFNPNQNGQRWKGSCCVWRTNGFKCLKYETNRKNIYFPTFWCPDFSFFSKSSSKARTKSALASPVTFRSFGKRNPAGTQYLLRLFGQGRTKGHFIEG